MKVGRRVHALVHVFFLNIGMTIDVDDSNILGSATGETSDGWIANGVVSSENNGKGAGAKDMSDGI
jgi:hypothetical protein